MYIDKQDDQVNQYNNRYHTTIKMDPVDKRCSIFIDFNKNSCKEDPKFKFRDHVVILITPNLYKRYVDDTFAKLKKNKPGDLYNALNNYHLNINLIIEVNPK